MLEKLKQLLLKIWTKIASFLPSYTFEIKAKDLEKRIATIFPIKKKKLIFVFKISDPQVELPPEKDSKIGIGITLKVSIPGLLSAQGRGLVMGEIDYWAEEGEFYFFDPEVRKLEIDGLPRRYQSEVAELFDMIIKSALGDMCIYKFNEKDRKQAIAKRLLKSVRVEDERLKVQVGF